MIFRFKGYTARLINEEFDIEVEEEDVGDAYAKAEQLLYEYPFTKTTIRKFLRVARGYEEPDYVELVDLNTPEPGAAVA